MKIIKPIFIIGAPRSGTTQLQKVLAQHPDVCTMTVPRIYSKFNVFFEEFCGFTPIIPNIYAKIFKKSLIPIEGTNIWTLRFIDKSDMLNEKHYNILRNTFIKKIIQNHLNFYKKERFLAKDPSLSFKIRYINKLFPDAKFIHIFRDGRAVVNSAKKRWRDSLKFRGWWGARPENWKIILKEKNLLLICARQWIETLKYIKKNKDLISDKLLEIKYGENVYNFKNIISEILDFTELEVNHIFIERIENFKPKNMNWKWRHQLKKEEIEILLEYKEFVKMLQERGFID